MCESIQLHEKTVRLEISRSALRAVRNLRRPLVADTNLILCCLVIKRAWFREGETPDLQPVVVLGKLGVGFRIVRYAKSCRISHINNGSESPSDFPLVADKQRFAPDWLKIDFRGRKWTGSLGYGG